MLSIQVNPAHDDLQWPARLPRAWHAPSPRPAATSAARSASFAWRHALHQTCTGRTCAIEHGVGSSWPFSPVLRHQRPATQRCLSARKPRCDAPDRAQKSVANPDPIINDPVRINIGLQMEWPVHDADARAITWRVCNGLKSAALSTPSRRRSDLVIVQRLGHRSLNERAISRF